jgi:glycosyltransferase involved in cell wall biosynthesis
MGLNRALDSAQWRVGDASSRLLLDIAAGRPIELNRPLNDDEMELAVRHGLIGLMAGHDNPNLIGASIAVYARLAARHGVMRRHLRRILVSLSDAGIRATVLKGFHLAEWAYRDPAQRTTTDIDLLVPAGDVERALEVLADDEAVQAIPAKTPAADKRNVLFADSSGVRFTVDLHWDLFSYTQLRGCAAGATDWAWDHATLDQDHELGPMWELPEAARIAFLCTHALLDHRFRLILFRDLAEVADTQPDWDAVLRFAERWRLRSVVYLALIMAAGTMGAAVPSRVLIAMRKPGTALSAGERMLPRTDIVRFDGHRAHPLNLAIVLTHDEPRSRVGLLLGAPAAFPHWQARVAGRADLAPRSAQTRASRPLVLHVLPIDLARGAQTYAQAMREALDDHHARHVTLTIFQSRSVVLDTDIALDVVPGKLRRAGFDLRAAWALRKALQADLPAVVVAHGGESLKYATIAVPRNTKLVYYKIGTSAVHFRSRGRHALYRLLLRRTDLVAGVSREMVDEAQQLLGVPASRTAYVANGRDPARFRAAHHGETDLVSFSFVGHLTRTKRPLRFVRVMQALIDRGIPVRGVMVGDGPLEARVVDAAALVNTEVLGRRDDVPELLAESDVFLFTSVVEGEGMPGVLIEAGLAGLPTVSTDVPGARTVIDDGVSGVVVDPDDFRGFVDACERLARDPELRASMGQAARERCMRGFTLEASARRWEELLDALIDDRDIPTTS